MFGYINNLFILKFHTTLKIKAFKNNELAVGWVSLSSEARKPNPTYIIKSSLLRELKNDGY